MIKMFLRGQGAPSLDLAQCARSEAPLAGFGAEPRILLLPEIDQQNRDVCGVDAADAGRLSDSFGAEFC